MESDKVLWRVEEQTAYVSLNESRKLNALSHQLKEQLLHVLTDLEAKDNIKVIVLSGEGKAFCAGGDVKAMQNPYDAMAIKRAMNLSKQIVEKIRHMPKLVIAAVHGYAAGAGMSLALASDLVIAEKGTKFVLSFKNVGLVPDLGLHFLLTKQIGEWKAKEWIWTGKQLSVQEAMQHGFVMEEAETGKLFDSVHAFIRDIENGSFHAYVFSKLLINESSLSDIEGVMERENNLQTILRGSEAHQDALHTFMNRKNKQK